MSLQQRWKTAEAQRLPEAAGDEWASKILD
jgi:hypothetical protein